MWQYQAGEQPKPTAIIRWSRRMNSSSPWSEADSPCYPSVSLLEPKNGYFYNLGMIWPCSDTNLAEIHDIINEAAKVYRSVIPADRYKEPYMSGDELKDEIDNGVKFWACSIDDDIAGVMGIQDVRDVTLIRHAYVRSRYQRRGIGGMLLSHLRKLTAKPILIGTWADAVWAIRFYEKNGFVMTNEDEKNRLLAEYWDVPQRQIETSVVLREAGLDQ